MPRTARARPAPERPLWPLVALTLVAVGLLALLYEVAVRTATGQRLDQLALGGLDPDRSPRAHQATSELLETISVSSLALLGAAIAALALVRARLGTALGAVVLLLGANVTTQVLKRDLPHPDLVPGDPVVTAGSFPSGHVTVAMSLALALVLVVPAAARPLAAVVGGAYAAGVGVAVIALDWHRPSDVVGGYLVACAWTGLVAAALAWQGRDAAPRRRRAPAARTAGAAAALLAAAFLAVAGAAAVREADLLSFAGHRTAFVAAAATVGVAGAALASAVAALLRRTGPDPL